MTINKESELLEEIKKIKLSGFDIIKEDFEKNTEIEFNKCKLSNNLKVKINFGWNDEKQNLALKLEISILRKVKNQECENNVQSYLNLEIISLFEHTDIKKFIKYIQNKKMDNNTEVYEITNHLLRLSYPKVKEHIEYIFKNSNMSIKLPESLRVGD
ncbi:hypothetical protein FDF11_03620 [Clostridium botulinum]|nr:hypothetical protein [Clostridium botulinum]NFR15145.1 hypothetical protein [Clostridium botulinum]NFR44356.1 hypothetical protein [Clostridium botulinum]NFS49787.1 hypothetical protein [Clostridium botulinum]